MEATTTYTQSVTASEYERLFANQTTRKGRRASTLTDEQRRLREEVQRVENRRRAEARRRAFAVLQHRYSAEFSELYRTEYQLLSNSERYATPTSTN